MVLLFSSEKLEKHKHFKSDVSYLGDVFTCTLNHYGLFTQRQLTTILIICFIYWYIYIYIYIYMYIYIYLCLYIIYTTIYIQIFAYIHTYIYIYIYLHIIYICMYIYIHTYIIHIYMYLYIYTFIYVIKIDRKILFVYYYFYKKCFTLVPLCSFIWRPLSKFTLRPWNKKYSY